MRKSPLSFETLFTHSCACRESFGSERVAGKWFLFCVVHQIRAERALRVAGRASRSSSGEETLALIDIICECLRLQNLTPRIVLILQNFSFECARFPEKLILAFIC
jgi:hypothetical protein